MKPQDIDKTANLVVESLSSLPEGGLLGCGSVTSAVRYYAADCLGEQVFACADTYKCGRQTDFACSSGFACAATFDCADLVARGRHAPVSQEGFGCGEGDTLEPTASFPGAAS